MHGNYGTDDRWEPQNKINIPITVPAYTHVDQLLEMSDVRAVQAAIIKLGHYVACMHVPFGAFFRELCTKYEPELTDYRSGAQAGGQYNTVDFVTDQGTVDQRLGEHEKPDGRVLFPRFS